MTDGIDVGKDKLDRHTNYDLDIGLTMQYTSNKETMQSKVIDNEESETTSTMNTRNKMLSQKATTFSKVLQNIGIVSTEDGLLNEDSDKIEEDIISKNPLKREWASHPENSKFNFNDECIIKLLELYVKGKDDNNKMYRVTIERVCDILRNEIIPNNWTQKNNFKRT